MTRVAILGGGISGLTAAYELELARRNGAPIDWRLYEATNRLGGIIETTRHTTPEGDFILEGGPDAWVSEKPWAHDLAIELGLESDLITSNDATRKTYILQQNPGEAAKLQPIPDGMRLMVSEDLSALENSPLFTPTARAAYANELANAAPLKSTSPFADPAHDESVATFVLRHFGEEVLTKLAAPLLSGVFGGDVAKLSARAVMPQFVAMERDHGSLVAALQARASERTQPIFTSLRSGMASLTAALAALLPSERIKLGREAVGLEPRRTLWNVYTSAFRGQYDDQSDWTPEIFDEVLLCTPAHATKALLHFLPHRRRVPKGPADSLIPTQASSALLATFIWPAETARTFAIPSGFGFLVPQSPDRSTTLSSRPKHDSSTVMRSGEIPVSGDARSATEPQLLACTFVDQKFPHRAPPGARILRAFFGGPSAEALATQSDDAITALALTQLRAILGPIPEPSFTTVRRLPRSLPQYEVGHLARMAQLDTLIARIPGLHLLGNSYRGVGLPDLIRDARAAARRIAAGIS